MRTIFSALLVTTVFVSATAAAQVSLNSTRVVAKDVLATEAFYMKAFGMHEVNRIQMGDGNIEVMLNFGATEAEAKANPGAQVVIMHSETDPVDPVAHVIFTVTDVQATAAAMVAAGGKLDREPFEYANTGIFIGLGKDPAGNSIELIQFAKP